MAWKARKAVRAAAAEATASNASIGEVRFERELPSVFEPVDEFNALLGTWGRESRLPLQLLNSNCHHGE